MIRTDSRVELSIVIAAWNGPEPLRACLESLLPCGAGTEIVVATNTALAGPLASQFPHVRFLTLGERAVVPELRTAGILVSSGDIIAVTEDHCRCEQGWAAAIVRAHHDPAAAIGGPVENRRTERALDWAAYFYDYGKFMPPIREGPACELSGANVSYKRAALLTEVECFRDGFFEPVVHRALAKHGGLRLDSQAIVHHDKSHHLGQAVSQAYHLARGYAARRVQPATAATRVMLGVGSPLLFILLPARVIGGVLRKRRRLGALTRSLPYLLLLTGSWAWGEVCGYWAGAGGSDRRWR